MVNHLESDFIMLLHRIGLNILVNMIRGFFDDIVAIDVAINVAIAIELLDYKIC